MGITPGQKGFQFRNRYHLFAPHTHFHPQLSGPSHDLHSGIDGGIIQEPMVDLMKLLGSLTDDAGRVQVNGFFDGIRTLGPKEQEMFEDLHRDFDCAKYVESRGVTQLAPSLQDAGPTGILQRRWCQPSLTIHGIQSSVFEMSLIPHKVSA